MIGTAEPVIEEMEVKEKDQLLKEADMMEPVVSTELGPQAVVGTAYQHELTHGGYLLVSANFVLKDPLYSVRSGRESPNSHYNTLNVEGKVDALAL